MTPAIIIRDRRLWYAAHMARRRWLLPVVLPGLSPEFAAEVRRILARASPKA